MSPQTDRLVVSIRVVKIFGIGSVDPVKILNKAILHSLSSHTKPVKQRQYHASLAAPSCTQSRLIDRLIDTRLISRCGIVQKVKNNTYHNASSWTYQDCGVETRHDQSTFCNNHLTGENV